MFHIVCKGGRMILFNRIFDSAPINLLEKALAGSSLRHKVISDNIANINTPGYKRKEVLPLKASEPFKMQDRRRTDTSGTKRQYSSDLLL